MRVLVRESIADAGVELLRSKFEVDEDQTTPIAEIIDRYDAIVIRSATKLTAELIELATNLKMIGRAGVGVDNVDVEAATRRGIVVANAPESTVVSAAEQTVGLMVALARNIPQAHAALKQHRWERSKWSGVELEGKTLGVLGFGRIGQQVARRAIGLGMHVVAYDPFVADDRFRELGVEHAATEDDVLAAADFLTLHSPLTDETRGMINRDDDREDEGRRPARERRPRRADRRGGARRGADVRQAGGRRARRLLRGAVRRPAARPRQRRRDAAPRRLDGRGAGPGRRDHRRAGRGGARRRPRHERRQHPGRRQGLPRRARAVRPARGQLGRLAVELAGGRPRRVVVAAHGPISDFDTRLLTVAALDGIFRGRVDQTVNYVNASLLAAERGITVSEERLRASRDYMNVLEVRVTAEGGEEVEVSGTTIGPEPRLFLASAYGFGIDIELAPDMVFFRYDDIPGVIGKVGTLFGENGANIANMAVSRTRDGQQALMALSVDEPPSDALIDEMHSVGFGDAIFIELA